MKKISLRKYIAEFLGTFMLVFCGTGSVIVNAQSNGSLGLLGISVVFGIIVSVIIYIFGNISGAHINPAVTIALAIGKLMPKKDIIYYIIFQILGAILASYLLKFMFPENITLGTTLPTGEILQSFIIELILTFILMLTILGITSQKETTSLSGIVIGAIIIALILFSGPISGGSLNPARSLAPALISGNLTSLWIYLFAPTLGAVIAILSWKILTPKLNSN